MANHDKPVLPDFLKLWNFGDPAATEIKFRELIPIAENSGDANYLLTLLSQIARTLGLQGKFLDAHKMLDGIEVALAPEIETARVRYLLERGRVYNSSGERKTALPYFEEAADLAQNIGETNLAVDAIHMVAIAKEDPQEQITWNLTGIALAESNPGSRGWFHALYNNLGESYLLVKDYESAGIYFHKLVEIQSENGGEPDIYTLKDEAKTLRLRSKPDESLLLLNHFWEKFKSQEKITDIFAKRSQKA
ncbi:MAG: tetratricopeptide repeat protein [Ignavibacteriota bacterium]